VQSAVYQISFNGSPVANPTLEQGESHTASVLEGSENVTVTADELGYRIYSATAYIVVPYAVTTVASASGPVPEPEPEPIIDVEITSVSETPDKFKVDIEWETNVSANGTIFLSKTSGGSVYKTAKESDFNTEQSDTITGLKSYTNYYYYIEACTENSCVQSEEQHFKTLPVIPVITDVRTTIITDETATVIWNTDVFSDSTVFYRKLGTTEWIQVPPPQVYDYETLMQYLIFDFIPPEDPEQVVEIIGQPITGGIPAKLPDISIIQNKGLLSMPSKVVSFSPYGFSETGTISFAGGPLPYYSAEIQSPADAEFEYNYNVNSQFLDNAVVDTAIMDLIIQQSHAVLLSGLEDDTTYQYKASSCADLCTNSSIYTFKTELTLYPPYIAMSTYPTNVNHGSSTTVTMRAFSYNPGGTITDASLSWNDGGTKSLVPKFGGDADSILPHTLSEKALASITFDNTGSHTLTFEVTDSFGLSSSMGVVVTVNPKAACTGTSTKYYPTDTPCTNDWPDSGGSTVDYNNGIGACHAFEVCDDGLDYMIEDAENCCNGKNSFSSNPPQNHGYGYSKQNTCDAARDKARTSGPLTSLTASSTMKLCKAAYLTYGIGSQAVYVKDYYIGECCCKAASICDSHPHYQAGPWPQSNIHFNELWCYYYDWWIFGKSPKDGWYHSDTNPESNNNALADNPAHATVNRLNTGTCVDYGFVVATALRKAGYSKNEVMAIRTPGHVYNAVWLPGDTKYSFIDTVGNNGGDFFTGPGWDWTSGGDHYDHCDYNSNKCSNDWGMRSCPSKSNMWGC